MYTCAHRIHKHIIIIDIYTSAPNSIRDNPRYKGVQRKNRQQQSHLVQWSVWVHGVGGLDEATPLLGSSLNCLTHPGGLACPVFTCIEKGNN